MSGIDRRRFLLAGGTASVVGAVAGCLDQTRSLLQAVWDGDLEGADYASVTSVTPVDDGVLVSGVLGDDAGPAGFLVRLEADESRAWEYRSPEDAVETFTTCLSLEDRVVVGGWSGEEEREALLAVLDDEGDLLETGSPGDGAVFGSDRHEESAVFCGTTDGEGWVAVIDEDGTVEADARFDGGSRFESIESVDDTLVAVGETTAGDAWVVGVEEDGTQVWEDQLEFDDDAVATAVTTSDVGTYDVLVVGTVGSVGRRTEEVSTEPLPDGDGFVAAYGADGTRHWLEVLEDTPLFCAGPGPAGVLAGGSSGGNGWIGTVDRTAHRDDRESAVVSLAPLDDETVVAGGRRVDGEAVVAVTEWIDLTQFEADPPTDSDPDDDPDSDEDDDETDGLQESVEFLDCQTARVTGSFDDILLHYHWWEGDPPTLGNEVGVSVGGVDGERVVSVADATDADFEHGPVLTGVDAFHGEPVGIFSGDLSAQNPDVEACDAEYEPTPDGGSIEFLDCQSARVQGTFDEVLVSYHWWEGDPPLLGNEVGVPVGGVDGERVVSVADATDATYEYGPVLTGVDAFETGTAGMPMDGDISAANPQVSTCDAQLGPPDDPGEEEIGPDEVEEDDVTQEGVEDGADTQEEDVESDGQPEDLETEQEQTTEDPETEQEETTEDSETE